MMRVRVLLFAQIAEQAGAREIMVDLADGAAVHDAVTKLARQHEAIAALGDRLAVAVNERYARPTHPLHDGDTIALIPPVSGG